MKCLLGKHEMSRNFRIAAHKYHRANFIERDLKVLDLIEGMIEIVAHPFEIITLRFEK